MTEARVVLTAEDNASRVIDQVTKRLGVFNKEGIAMGISFALVNKAVELVSRGIHFFTQSMIDGMNRVLDFELNIVRLVNTIHNMDVSVNTLTQSLHKMSSTYGVSVNDLAVNMKTLTREGISVSDSLTIMNQANLVFLATGENVASVIDALDTVMNVFNYDAKYSGYIFSKLNDVYNNTNYSFQQFADIISRESPKIVAAGWSLEDVINALYSLAQKHVGSRTLGPEFEKLLAGESAIPMLKIPEGSGKTVEEGANDTINTNKKAIDVLGGMWDNYWDKFAQNLLNIGNITKIALTKQLPTKTVLSGMGDTSTDWLDDFILQNNKLDAEIKTLTATIDEETVSVDALYQQWDRGNIQQKYITEMHTATLEVQAQEDAINRLRRISNAYSLDQQVNNLRIMQIEYGAGRRGPTRGQQRQIDLIERDNMRLRIKEAEQQIAIGNIQQNGLQTAQDALDKIRRSHDQIIYDQELTDLKKHISDVYTEWKKMYEQLARDKAMLLNRQSLVTTLPFVGPPAPPGYTYQTASSQVARDNSRRRGVFDLR